MNETADSPVRQKMEPLIVGGFLSAVLFLLFYAHPLALLPPSLNFDRTPVRVSSLVILALPGIILGINGWRRKCLNASLFSGLLILTGILIVVMPKGSGGKIFAFGLPVYLLMVPLSIFLLTVKRVMIPRHLLVCASIFCLGVTAQLLRNPGNADLTIPFYAMALLPLCVSILYSQKMIPDGFLSYAAFGIFVISVYYGLGERIPVGISGNPNWYACTLLGVLPWAIWATNRWLYRIPALPRWVGIGIVICIPSAWVIYKCNTRAAYLAAGLVAIIVVFFSLRKVWLQIGWLVVCVSLTIGSLLFFLGYAKQALDQDVRAPIWFSSARLAGKDGLSLATGIGPRDIQYFLPDLLAESGYHNRFVASEWVQHPHNEMVHVVLNVGLPAGLAWLVMLLPLAANPLKLKGRYRVAWFSAFPMLILGFADKGLQWGPAILWFPICLGILWSNHFEPEKRSSSEVIGKLTLGAFALGILSSILVAYLAYHQIRSSWHNRRGEQLSAHGHYAAARTYYMKALEHVPNDAPLAYKIAGTSLQDIRPFDAELVGSDLARAYQINPNFAHINIFMGRYLLMTGRKEEALNFFLRDVELFPENVKTHQWLVHALLVGRNVDLLDDAQRALHRKYNQRIYSFADIKHRTDLPVSWLNALDEADWETLAGELNFFLPQLKGHHSIDPAKPWNSGKKWPLSFVGITCHPEDIQFWKSVLFRETYREENQGRSGDPAELAWRILDHIKISDADAGWDYPHRVWATKSGTEEACFSLLSWLSEDTVLIVTEPGDPNTSSALIFPPPERAGAPVLQVYFKRRLVKFLSSEELSSVLKDAESKVFYPALPHEFLIRHQVLDALSNKVAAYREQLDFATIPSIEYLKLRARYPELPKRIMCWQPPAEAVRQRISATVDGDEK